MYNVFREGMGPTRRSPEGGPCGSDGAGLVRAMQQGPLPRGGCALRGEKGRGSVACVATGLVYHFAAMTTPS